MLQQICLLIRDLKENQAPRVSRAPQEHRYIKLKLNKNEYKYLSNVNRNTTLVISMNCFYVKGNVWSSRCEWTTRRKGEKQDSLSFVYSNFYCCCFYFCATVLTKDTQVLFCMEFSGFYWKTRSARHARSWWSSCKSSHFISALLTLIIHIAYYWMFYRQNLGSFFKYLCS